VTLHASHIRCLFNTITGYVPVVMLPATTTFILHNRYCLTKVQKRPKTSISLRTTSKLDEMRKEKLMCYIVQFISYTAVNNVPSSGRLGMSSSSRSYTANSGIPYDTPSLDTVNIRHIIIAYNEQLHYRPELQSILHISIRKAVGIMKIVIRCCN